MGTCSDQGARPPKFLTLPYLLGLFDHESRALPLNHASVTVSRITSTISSSKAWDTWILRVSPKRPGPPFLINLNMAILQSVLDQGLVRG
jgi:hypothetical protein